MQFNSIATPISYKDAMAMRLTALLNKQAIKLRAAHLRRFAYLDLKPLPVKDGRLFPHYWNKALDREQSGKINYVSHRYMSPIGYGKKYDGPALRALRAARGCGKCPTERPRRLQQHVRVMLPWNSEYRVVCFDMRKDDAGKPYFGDVKILRRWANRRDKRLERSLTDEQWTSLFRNMARVLRPA